MSGRLRKRMILARISKPSREAGLLPLLADMQQALCSSPSTLLPTHRFFALHAEGKHAVHWKKWFSHIVPLQPDLVASRYKEAFCCLAGTRPEREIALQNRCFRKAPSLPYLACLLSVTRFGAYPAPHHPSTQRPRAGDPDSAALVVLLRTSCALRVWVSKQKSPFGCGPFRGEIGGDNPTGDERFLFISRQPKCIPIVAKQSVASLKDALPNEGVKTLLQAFRTKVFLSTSDPETARYASELCGKADRTAISYTVSESSSNANFGWLSGRTSSSKSSVSASKQYQKRKEPLFEEKIFFDLKNAQAVTVAFDGISPVPAT